MKLVRQVKLYFQEGTSDKVYEIDLCESGDGYLVNFRYGRRGGALKEGTKTIFPVPLPEAEKVLDALEQEKRKKGYVAAGEAPIVTGSVPTNRSGTDKRKKAIVKLLKATAAGEEPEHWPLSRIIWRAGDLKIKEAIPYIIQIANPSDKANIYSVVWSIGRCGTSDALGFVQNLQKDKNLPEHTQQLIFEVILRLSADKDKEGLLNGVLQALPGTLRSGIATKDPQQLRKALNEYLFELKTTTNDYLVGVYQLVRNDDKLHSVFLDVLRQITLAPNYFKYVRRIFKTAEMLQDYATYGVVAKQIEKQSASRRAFSIKTKEYLVKRTLRQLRKYGTANEGSYVDLAAQLLLAFRDEEDARQPHHTSTFSYNYNAETRSRTTEEKRTNFDAFSSYRAFNYILYQNSTRYRPLGELWVCNPTYKPGDAAPVEREEAFPHLWNDAPDAVLTLLKRSRVTVVHEFALKVWRANPAFEQNIEMADIIALLLAYSTRTQALALELARKKYSATQPDTALLIAMLDSPLEEARKQAGQWISEVRSTLLTDTAFVSQLLQMKSLEAHAWLRSFLTTHSFTRQQAEIIVASGIAFLITADIHNEDDERYFAQVGDSILICFGEFVKYISFDIIKDLFKHRSSVIHAFAGKILMKHEVKPEDLPEDFLTILLTSADANSRAIGISLLGKFPEDLLLQRKEVLVSFCLSSLADVRNAIKPIILKLTRAYPDFGKELVNLFVPAFLIKESYEGLHEDLLSLLSNELKDSLHVIPRERTLVLLNSRYRTSQRIGQILLMKTLTDDELTVPELVKLGSNPLLAVREFVWNTFKKYPEKVKALKDDAIKITDTDWDDTRIFAFDFFRNTFSNTDWTTDLLIILCDSTREDVQDFGREMITRFFEANQGTDYLMKLSQHPSAKVQLFATSYLQQYAAGNTAVLNSLKLYFITLLSQVNKARVAKKRIIDFLRDESLKNEEAARVASEVFTRVSVSVAITERAACVAALRDIQKQFPAIKSPLVIKEFDQYTSA